MRSDAKVALGVSAVLLAGIIGFALFVPPGKTDSTSMSVRPATPMASPSTPTTPLPTPNETARTEMATTVPTSMPTLVMQPSMASTSPSGGGGMGGMSAGTASGMPSEPGMTGYGTGMGEMSGGTAAGTPAGPSDWNALLAGKVPPVATPSGPRTATGSTPSFGTVSTPTSVLPSPTFGSTRPSFFGTPVTGGSGVGGSGVGGSGVGGATSGTENYAIKRGDTFGTIAAARYGNSKYWKVIAEANPTVDSRRLKVGQSIKLPELPAKYSGSTPTGTVATMKGPLANTPGAAVSTGSAPANVDPRSQYQVQSGDSLYRISVKLYGTPAQADAIYELNKETIGTNKANLKINQVLRLPMAPTKP